MKVTTKTVTVTGVDTDLSPTVNPADVSGEVGVSGTFTSAPVTVEGKFYGGSVWYPLNLRDRKTGGASNGSFTPADSTATSVLFDARGLSAVRAYPTGGTVTGGVLVEIVTGQASDFGGLPFQYPIVFTSVSSFGAGITFAGATGANTITIPAALASACTLTDGVVTYLSINSSTGNMTLSAAGKTMTVNGLIAESATNAITAFATGGQGSAVALSTEINRITVCATAGDSVKLPASAAGLTIMVVNTGAANLAVFPAAGDAVNGGSANASVTQMPNSVVFYCCPVAGSWFAEGIGGGYAGSLATALTVGGISAAGTTQGTGTTLTGQVNRVTTCAANAGVVLPANAVGLAVTVTNDGANACNVYPDSGAAINSLATNAGTPLPVGTTATFYCEAANVWKTLPVPPRELVTTLTTVGAGTVLAASFVGGEVTRTLIGSAATDTTDTAANIIAALHGAAIGQSWEFTYVNNTAFVVTLAAGAGVTFSEQASGTSTVPANSWARFLVTVASATTVTVTGIAQGPNSVLQPAKFTSINVTTGTLAAGNASGAAFVSLTSTNATPGNQAMRTVAQVLADTPGLAVGMSYLLRITQTGAGTLTLTTDGSAQFTMTGTMTVPINTFRDFVVTINSATAGTVQAVGTGTFS